MKLKIWAAVLVVAIGIIGFLIFRSTVFCEDCGPQESERIEDTVNAIYDLEVSLNEANEFQVAASIDVTNYSSDTWDDIGFYLVPNAMNSEETSFYEDDDVWLEITAVTVDKEESDYNLDNNELLVELDTDLEPASNVTVQVEYSMVLPQNGMRLSQVDNNFYLAIGIRCLAITKMDGILKTMTRKASHTIPIMGTIPSAMTCPETIWSPVQL